MPNASPSIEFVAPPVLFGTAIALQLSADGPNSMVTEALAAEEGPGSAAALASLGFIAGVAPPGTTTLDVRVSGLVGENAFLTAFFSVATGDAAVRFYVEEFSASGAFLNAQEGTPAAVYAVTETGFGADARLNEWHSVNLSSSFSITPGHFYRVWIDSLQGIANTGAGPQSFAVLSFVYQWGLAFFQFV